MLDLATRLADATFLQALHAELDAQGFARIPSLLTSQECSASSALYAQSELFRSQISMQRHGYGQGEYRYFAYPLPELVADLRTTLYAGLVGLANRWHAAMGLEPRFPPQHQAFVERCHRAGQTRPTPLILKYTAGDYNCLHQDLYGEHVFPLQVAILLSRPGVDFEGGQVVLTEQRPRAQSRVSVVSLAQGDAVVFAVAKRPVMGKRGVHKVNMRHGVSTLLSGNRYTLGVIFHDAT